MDRVPLRESPDGSSSVGFLARSHSPTVSRDDAARTLLLLVDVTPPHGPKGQELRPSECLFLSPHRSAAADQSHDWRGGHGAEPAADGHTTAGTGGSG